MIDTSTDSSLQKMFHPSQEPSLAFFSLLSTESKSKGCNRLREEEKETKPKTQEVKWKGIALPNIHTWLHPYNCVRAPTKPEANLSVCSVDDELLLLLLAAAALSPDLLFSVVYELITRLNSLCAGSLALR